MINMTPQALEPNGSRDSEKVPFIIYSPERGLISEHMGEEDARAAFESFIAEIEFAEYLPFLLRREGEDWEFA